MRAASSALFAFASASASAEGTNLWLRDSPSKSSPTTDPNWAAATTTYLDELVATQGPFFGILGYSQGAAMIPIYLAHVPDNTFQVAMLYCGYLSSLHRGLMANVDRRSPFGGIPALVFTASNEYQEHTHISRTKAHACTERGRGREGDGLTCTIDTQANIKS